MNRSSSRIRILGAVLACLLAPCLAFAQPLEPGDCPPADLAVVLNTGWDQSTAGVLIPPGNPDDDWDVTVDASGGTVPRDADVINPNSAWLTLPNSNWISAAATGPNGTYVYEMCWCMDDDFSNPNLSFELRADDQADVFLNGAAIASTPNGSFNDTIPTTVSITDPSMFFPGQNCLEVEVHNLYGVVTGMNLAGTMTADDGLCCGCDPNDLLDDADTGVDDDSGTVIPVGGFDDEWEVVASASGGILPRPADVVTKHAAWSLIPGTAWISADYNGPNGTYVYEKCWCMHESYVNPSLTMQLLADDRADVFLNGNLIGSTPNPGFTIPATTVSTNDPLLFHPGKNCVQVRVQNTSSVVTGMNASLQIHAENGECCPCVDIPADAEGWWTLDETSGVTSFDLLNGHDGTHSELFATPPSPTPVTGMVNGALEFDAIDDWVNVPDAPGLNFGVNEDLSIDAWIKTPSPLRQVIVQKKQIAIVPGYAFYTSAGVLNFEISDGTTFTFCIGNTLIDDNQWHFVAVTLDRDQPGGIRLYVDGVLDQSCSPLSVTGSLVNTDSVHFGGDPLAGPTGAGWFEGPIDEIELFRRALTTTEVQSIYLAGNGGKCPPNHCEDSTGLPVCEGECDPGLVCVDDPAGVDACSCEPVGECHDGPYPQCGGTCDQGGTCLPVAPNVCDCVIEQCEQSPYPTCGGDCPPGMTCLEGPAQDCFCQMDEPCDLSPYPTCGGFCPIGQTCISGANQDCFCDDDPIQCDQSEFPVCDGDCPAGLECIEGPAQDCFCAQPEQCGDPGDFPVCDGECPQGLECIPGLANDCFCVQPEQCGDPGDYPVCDGACPDGLICVDDGNNCDCIDPNPTQCSDTFYPECGGVCPPGSSCQNILGTDNCDCVDDKPVCGADLVPECGGACPVNQTCIKVEDATGVVVDCECQSCVVVGPATGTPISVAWPATKEQIRWSPIECALVYNLYRKTAPRLVDFDRDGLADDYGSCYIEDIVGTSAPEASKPPPGSTHWYLVTGENFVGEISLGNASNGLERPNTSPCP